MPNSVPDEQLPLVQRLRLRSAIRRTISTRKSVQEGKPDRISDLLDEAANEIERLQPIDNTPVNDLWDGLSDWGIKQLERGE